MCYAVPLTGAIITSFVWSKKRDVQSWWLSLILYGGALFGVIDHLWNGELFLISKNMTSDLLLGVAITAAMFLFWRLLLLAAKTNPTLATYVNIKKF